MLLHPNAVKISYSHSQTYSALYGFSGPHIAENISVMNSKYFSLYSFLYLLFSGLS